MTISLAEQETQAASVDLHSLLQAHFDEAEESADDEGKFSIGFRVTFDRSYSPTKLKVTCRVTKVITDEIECAVDRESPQSQPAS